MHLSKVPEGKGVAGMKYHNVRLSQLQQAIADADRRKFCEKAREEHGKGYAAFLDTISPDSWNPRMIPEDRALNESPPMGRMVGRTVFPPSQFGRGDIEYLFEYED